MIELDWTCRAILAVVLATAASAKLGGAQPLAEFARALRQFGVPAALATRSIAAAAIACEAAAAALLLIAPLAGYALACALLGAFTVAIASALAAHRRVACRCFGATTAPLGRAHVIRNLILVLAAVTGAAARSLTAAAASPDSGWLCIVVGVVIGAAITRWDDLSFLFGAARPRT